MGRTGEDRFVKRDLSALLETGGRLETRDEVTTEPPWVDLHPAPLEQPPSSLLHLGLRWRRMSVDCLLEHYIHDLSPV